MKLSDLLKSSQIDKIHHLNSSLTLSLTLKMRLLIFLFSFVYLNAFGQVFTNPFFPNQNDFVTITYDASQGNQALQGESPIYIHCGLITSESSDPSDWQHVMGNWGVADSDFQMTDIGDNLHQFSFQLDTYFDLSPNEEVFELAFVFRNAIFLKTHFIYSILQFVRTTM